MTKNDDFPKKLKVWFEESTPKYTRIFFSHVKIHQVVIPNYYRNKSIGHSPALALHYTYILSTCQTLMHHLTSALVQSVYAVEQNYSTTSINDSITVSTFYVCLLTNHSYLTVLSVIQDDLQVSREKFRPIRCAEGMEMQIHKNQI